MSEGLKKFHTLLEEIKNRRDDDPIESLKAFTHFLKETKEILRHANKQEREKIFEEFQNNQPQLEEAMSSMNMKHPRFKDPQEIEKVKAQLEKDEYKLLIKEMSEDLFEIITILSGDNK